MLNICSSNPINNPMEKEWYHYPILQNSKLRCRVANFPRSHGWLVTKPRSNAPNTKQEFWCGKCNQIECHRQWTWNQEI